MGEKGSEEGKPHPCPPLKGREEASPHPSPKGKGGDYDHDFC